MQIMRIVWRDCAVSLMDSYRAGFHSFIAACRRGRAILSLLFAVAGVWAVSGQDVRVEVTYAFDVPQIATVKDEYTRLSVKGCAAFQKIGQPEVPFRTGKILLPLGAQVKQVDVELLQAVQTLSVTKPLTFGRTPVPIGVKDHPAVARAARDAPDHNTYAADAPYPASRVQLVSVQKMNGYSVAIVRIFPIQYQPASGKLLFCPQMRVSVTLAEAKTAVNDVSLLRRQDPQLSKIITFADNPDAAEAYHAQVLRSVKPLMVFDYLLVTTAALTNSFQPLVEQKIADGLSVKVETVENILAGYSGVDDAAKLRTFITYAYTNWNTTYVLLGGDISTVPYRQAYANVGGDVDATMPCDLYFACLDGSWNSDGDNNWGEPTDGEGGGDVDLLAEVYVGRAPVDNAAEVAYFIGKTLSYEQNKHANAASARFLAEYLGKMLGHLTPTI